MGNANMIDKAKARAKGAGGAAVGAAVGLGKRVDGLSKRVERGDDDSKDTALFCLPNVRDRPCHVRREGGKSLVIGGPSLVILEGKACNPL